MTHRTIHRLLIVLLICILDVNASAESEVRAKAIAVSESRFKVLDKAAGDDLVPLQDSSVSVSVELQGGPVADAVAIGLLKVKASDDKGNELKQSTFMLLGGDDKFTTIDRHQMWLGLEDPPKDRIRLNLNFVAPPREATKLASIEGSVKLMVGKGQDLIVANPGKQVNKEIVDPLLKQAGIKVTLESFDPKGGSFVSYAKVRVQGKIGALAKFDIVDEAGKSLVNGFSVGGFEDIYSHEALGTDPLPAGARLRLTVITDMKEVEVPIKLKDVPLP
ncbi:MAG: hypothetical protein WD768_03805 [Phycisphaeraceae bacterium]